MNWFYRYFCCCFPWMRLNEEDEFEKDPDATYSPSSSPSFEEYYLHHETPMIRRRNLDSYYIR